MSNPENGDGPTTIGVRTLASDAVAANGNDATRKSGAKADKAVTSNDENHGNPCDDIVGNDNGILPDGRGPKATATTDAAALTPFLQCCQHLPHTLKQHAVSDYVMVKENDKLPMLFLPASPCVAAILERWKVHAVERGGKKRDRIVIRSIEQVVEGLKKYVNVLADEGMLFYPREKDKYVIRIQEEKTENEAGTDTTAARDVNDNMVVQVQEEEEYEKNNETKGMKKRKKDEEMMKKEVAGMNGGKEKEGDIGCASACREACFLYGAEHLLRTIAVLPDIMARQDDVTASRLQNRIKELLRYLSDHYNELFTKEYRSKEEWLRIGEEPAENRVVVEVKPEEQAEEMQKDNDGLEEERQQHV